MRFLILLARIFARKTSILKELYEMTVILDALSTAVDNAVAKLASVVALQAALDKATADLAQANTDAVTAQATIDSLTEKLKAATV